MWKPEFDSSRGPNFEIGSQWSYLAAAASACILHALFPYVFIIYVLMVIWLLQVTTYSSLGSMMHMPLLHTCDNVQDQTSDHQRPVEQDSNPSEVRRGEGSIGLEVNCACPLSLWRSSVVSKGSRYLWTTRTFRIETLWTRTIYCEHIPPRK